MKNILFLVHVEESFRHLFPDEMYPLRLSRACRAKKYDDVFIMVSNIMDKEPIREVEQETWNGQWIDWGWGYQPEQFENDEEEEEFIIPALGHEWTWIPPEIRNMNFSGCKVFVGGGCESECLQDFCDILDHLEVDYEKVRGYIYLFFPLLSLQFVV